MTAVYQPRVRLAVGAIIFLLLGFWFVLRLTGHGAGESTYGSQFRGVYTFAFALLVAQMVLAFLEPAPQPTRDDDPYNVAVCIPAYNEDPTLLRSSLDSFLRQTRRPDTVSLVDDGSTAVDYTPIRDYYWPLYNAAGIELVWQRTQNRQKRHAQVAGWREAPRATIIGTVDSDTLLDPECIRKALGRFDDPSVMSVCGIILAANNQVNLLARFTDLSFVTQQLTDRSAMSGQGRVLVNSGGFAMYRAEILRDNEQAYLNEMYRGRRVEFSDDSMLTLYALERGKTVQQPDSFVFTGMPERYSHHLRQQLRWMRGSFIRSLWRLKYLPIRSVGYWRQLLGWIQLALSTVVFATLFVVQPIVTHQVHPELVLIPLAIGYGQSLRYLTFRRSDMTLAQHLLIYSLAPIAALWTFLVLRPVRFYGMLTAHRTGWGTRQNVEIDMEGRMDPGITGREDI